MFENDVKIVKDDVVQPKTASTLVQDGVEGAKYYVKLGKNYVRKVNNYVNIIELWVKN